MTVKATAHAYITSVQDGKPGEPGTPGPMFYQAGVWNKMNTYVRNNDICPFVLYDTGNPETDKFYYPAFAGTIAANASNKTPNLDTRWKVMNYFEVIQTKVLFARMGTLGSAVFYDDYMFSQHGVDNNGVPTSDYSGFANGNFQPNYKVNLKTGKLECYETLIHGAIRRKSLVTEPVQNSIGTYWTKIDSEYNIYFIKSDVDSVGVFFFSPGIRSVDIEFEVYNVGLGTICLEPPVEAKMFLWRGKTYERVYLSKAGTNLSGIWGPVSKGLTNKYKYDSMFIIKNQSDFYEDGEYLRSR